MILNEKSKYEISKTVFALLKERKGKDRKGKEIIALAIKYTLH